MSRLRPTLTNALPTDPSLGYEAAYFRVLQAVATRRALIHGRLQDRDGNCCAIGSYFAETSVAIPNKVVDEIAAYNDSFPALSPRDRWRKVVQWLRWQTKVLAAKNAVKTSGPVMSGAARRTTR